MISVKMVRLEMRTPPTLIRGQTFPRRSGALMIDVCGFSAMAESTVTEEHEQAARKQATIASPPTDRQYGSDQKYPSSGDSDSSPTLRMEWHLICVAFCRPLGILFLWSITKLSYSRTVLENAATGILSIGPLTSPYTSTSTRTRASDTPHTLEVPVMPYVSVSQSEVLTEGEPRSLLGISAKIPLVRVSLDKPRLDLVQLWADDVTQWAERLSNVRAAKISARDTVFSNNTSLIGSRFFSRRPKSISSSFTTTSGTNTASSLKESPNPTEVSIKCSITEGRSQTALNLFMVIC